MTKLETINLIFEGWGKQANGLLHIHTTNYQRAHIKTTMYNPRYKTCLLTSQDRSAAPTRQLSFVLHQSTTSTCITKPLAKYIKP
jgi:hypothetical protein